MDPRFLFLAFVGLLAFIGFVGTNPIGMDSTLRFYLFWGAAGVMGFGYFLGFIYLLFFKRCG